MTKELTPQKKGDAYERLARDVLQQCYKAFGINAFDYRKPGIQWVEGDCGKHKCDVTAYRDNQDLIIFSCKFRGNEPPKKGDVSELYLTCLDTHASEGWLITNVELTETPEKLAAKYITGTIVLTVGQTFDEYVADLRQLFGQVFIGASSSFGTADECNVQIVYPEEMPEVTPDSADS